MVARADHLTRFQPGQLPPLECRCKATRWNGQPCRRWRLKGDVFCAFHVKNRRANPDCTLPVRYARYLKPQLKRTLEEFIRDGNAGALDLVDELVMFREVASRAVGTYSAALEAHEADPENEKKRELVELSAALMKDSLREVKDMCEAAARVQAHSKGVVPANFMATFVTQVVQVAYKAFEDDERVDTFAKLLRTEVKMPGVESSAEDDAAIGTSSLPSDVDRAVALMDGTVPL